MTFHWLVSGVARSGTTALYLALQSYLTRSLGGFTFRYEPYLWGPPIWKEWDLAKADFQNTASLHIAGMYAHTQTPLFCNTFPPADPFVATVFPEQERVLAKMIRGSGRLEAWLAAVPNLKIVHVVRNPLDCINSALGRFSMFGSEFHPSDFPRFRREVLERFGVVIEPKKSPAQRALAWWQFMNEAAIETARAHPDRVLVLCQESFSKAPLAVLAEMCAFFGQQMPARDDYRFGLKGTVTREVNLKRDDVEALRPQHDEYFARAQAVSGIPLHFEPADEARSVAARYQGAEKGAFVPRVSAEFGPLDMRRRLIRSYGQTADLRKHNEFLNALLHDARRTLRAAQNIRVATYKQLDEHITAFRKRRPIKALSSLSREFAGELDQIELRSRILSGETDVSCIVTSYNNGEALLRAVNSIRAQAINVREIIVADDSSNDGSLEAVVALARTAPEIKIVRRERNLGPALNRHLAITDSQGAFITTLDGDDQFGPLKLLHEWQALRGRHDCIAFSNHALVGGRGAAKILETHDFANASSPGKRVAALALRSVNIPRDFLYSKELYLKAGGYDPQIRLYEDWSLKMRLAALPAEWVHADCLGTLYHQHDRGLSSADQSMHAFWKVVVLARNEGVLFQLLETPVIADALRRAFAHIDDEDLRERLQATLKVNEEADLSDRLRSLLRPLQAIQASESCVTTADAQRVFRELLESVAAQRLSGR